MARSGNRITAGDGLGAFGAAHILAVQLHLWTSQTTAGQLICTKQAYAQQPRFTKNYGRQIRSELTIARAAARGKLEPQTSDPPAAGRQATAAAGEMPGPITPAQANRGRRRLSDVSHSSAVASSRQPPVTAALLCSLALAPFILCAAGLVP